MSNPSVRSQPSFENRGAEIACPRGCGELEFATITGVKVASCRSCHGSLLQSDAFARLVACLRAEYLAAEITPTPLDPRDLEHRVPCPVCQAPLETHPYYGPGAVAVDSCAACGLVWLDGQELARIESAPGRR